MDLLLWYVPKQTLLNIFAVKYRKYVYCLRRAKWSSVPPTVQHDTADWGKYNIQHTMPFAFEYWTADPSLRYLNFERAQRLISCWLIDLIFIQCTLTIVQRKWFEILLKILSKGRKKIIATCSETEKCFDDEWMFWRMKSFAKSINFELFAS